MARWRLLGLRKEGILADLAARYWECPPSPNRRKERAWTCRRSSTDSREEVVLSGLETRRRNALLFSCTSQPVGTADNSYGQFGLAFLDKGEGQAIIDSFGRRGRYVDN